LPPERNMKKCYHHESSAQYQGMKWLGMQMML